MQMFRRITAVGLANVASGVAVKMNCDEGLSAAEPPKEKRKTPQEQGITMSSLKAGLKNLKKRQSQHNLDDSLQSPVEVGTGNTSSSKIRVEEVQETSSDWSSHMFVNETNIPRPSAPTEIELRSDGIVDIESGHHNSSENVIGSYTKHQLIGSGGFGIVHEVSKISDPSTRFAMKELRKDKATSKHIFEAAKEAKMLTSLEHDNLIKCHEAFFYLDSFYMILDLANHGDLSKFIYRQKTIYLNMGERFKKIVLLDALTEILSGLSYLHSRKIIHRDLKPANILLHKIPLDDGEQKVIFKITDFGLAKDMDETSKEFLNSRVGTFMYMSPEAHDRHYSLEADIWSVGCVFYELCMLERAFNKQSEISAPSGPVPRINKSYYFFKSGKKREKEDWRDLREICKNMLNRKTDERPTSQQLLEQSERLLSKEQKRQDELSNEVITTTSRIQMFIAAFFDDDTSTDISSSDRSLRSNSVDLMVNPGFISTPTGTSTTLDDGRQISEKKKSTFSPRTKTGLVCVFITIIATVAAVVVISFSFGDSGSAPGPTVAPTPAPSLTPTPPTAAPTESPSVAPTMSPSSSPTAAPSKSPSVSPSAQPSESPSAAPTAQPTLSPTPVPTRDLLICDFDITITNDSPVNECHQVVGGNVAVGVDFCGDLSPYLPNLEEIVGNLLVVNTNDCGSIRTEIHVPNLRRATSVQFQNNVGTNKGSNFPALTHVDLLLFDETEGFDTHNFPVLEEVRDFSSPKYGTVPSLNFDSLTKTRFDISAVEDEDCPVNEWFCTPQTMHNNFFGNEMRLPALREIVPIDDGSFAEPSSIIMRISSSSIVFPVLEKIGSGVFTIHNNFNLLSVSFPQLTQEEITDWDLCWFVWNTQLAESGYHPSWLTGCYRP